MSTSPEARAQKVRLIAFYLPQFHPIAENDQWWGKGFTEWTNVTKAQPLFEEHYQPHLPTELGFYDLRLRQTRHEQIELAKSYGIDGFCYHYYWFSGKRLLNKPIDDMLADPASEMPFCFCWANENWTRRWDAADHEVLIAQQYREEDDLAFIQELAPVFRDPRYIRVDGKPLLIVYRVQHLPDPLRTAAIWRNHCREAGIGEIHLCAALTHGNESFRQYGFDSGVEFPPHNLRDASVNAEIQFFNPFKGYVLQFATIARSYLTRDYADEPVFKTVFPSWDNTARTGQRAVVVLNGTPANYAHWLSSTIEKTLQAGASDPLVFINAWNEWAEGCHLEPDRKYGRAFLEATAAAKRGEQQFPSFPHTALPTVSEPVARLFWPELQALLQYHLWRRAGNLRLAINRKPWARALLLPVVRAARKLGFRL
ncbi:MAG: glycosyl hydrolase [Betaproteobacteria bacterium]|nr:glycosyl hydrolase [Betaproteobacteria bacterium]